MGEALHPLEDWVFDENRIVTYKLFSQLKGISSSLAQRMLGEFAGKHPQRVQAIYLLTGGAGDGGVHTVRLVSQEKLEDAKRAMSPLLSCHVYSVQQAYPATAHLLWEAGHESQLQLSRELRSGTAASGTSCLEDNRYGAIRGNGVRRAGPTHQQQPQPSLPPPKPAAAGKRANEGAGASAGIPASTTAKPAADKAASKPAAKPAAGGGVASLWAKQSASVPAPPATASAKPAAAAAQTPSSTAAPPKDAAANGKASHAASEEITPPAADGAGGARKRSRIVCEEDDETDAPAEKRAEASPARAKGGTPGKASEPPAQPRPQSPPPQACEPSAPASAEKPVAAQQSAPAPSVPTRVERHKRTRTYLDSRGYMVTEEYTEEVTVQLEHEAQPKPRSQPAPQAKAGGGDSGKEERQPSTSPPPASKKPAKKPDAPKPGKVPAAGKLTSFFTKK